MARFVRTPGLNTLCTPAYLYFMLSVVLLIFTGIFMNTDGAKQMCNGNCNMFQVTMLFVIKFIFIVFWTWILNVLCRGGAGWLSWFLVLFPFIMIIAVLLTIFGNALFTGASSVSSYSQQLVQPIQMPQVPMTQVTTGGSGSMGMPSAMGGSGSMGIPSAMGDTSGMMVNNMPPPRM